MNRNYALLFSLLVALLLVPLPAGAQGLQTRDVATGLTVPWEIIWGPDNWIWYTERPGRVSRVNPETGEKKLLVTIPNVSGGSEDGLLGMALHPNFADSAYVYLVYTLVSSGIRERLVRYEYDGSALVNPTILLDNIRGNGTHNGSRLVITPDRKLMMTLGDAQIAEAPQSHMYLNGKIIRLNLDGSAPADNPYADDPPLLTNRIWTSGHRNPQGLVYANGILYSSEHGPGSDDEINIIEKGNNYGWPFVEGFCNTQAEKKFCEDSSVTEPIAAWTPTIAVAGIDYYDHPAIPQWRGSLLMATLAGRHLRILKLGSDKRSIVSQETMYNTTFGRLRDICIAPDGRVFICTSNRDGRGNPAQNDDRIIEIIPQAPPTGTIGAPTADRSSYRAGDPIEASFTATGEFQQGNIFTLQLSDANGSFSSPTPLASLTGLQGGTVNGMLSCDLFGGDYRLRVISSDPPAVGSVSAAPIPISAKPQVGIEAGGPTSFCEGGSVDLVASPGFVHYMWSTGVTGPSISVTTSGTYTVRSIDSSQCNDTASIVVTIHPNPPRPQITRDAMVLTSSAESGNRWYRNDEPIAGATGRTYTVVEDGTYTVSVTTEHDCSAISEGMQVTVEVSSVPGEEPSAPGTILLYPHPVKGVLTLEFLLPRGGDVEMIVTDVSGREVMRETDEGASGLYRRELQVEGLAPGVYHLRAISGSIEWIGRFVKE